MQLMSVSVAARHLGYKSRSQLYKLMNHGWLDAYVHVQMPSGQRLLGVDGLQKTLQGICQWRVDSVFLRQGAISSGPQVKAERLPCAASVQVALIPLFPIVFCWFQSQPLGLNVQVEH